VTHTFLLEAGRWLLQGTWLERDGITVPVQGKTLIGWGRDGWYTMVTKLSFPSAERDEIVSQYRGHLTTGVHQYTFVLQHSQLGRVEGEGWVAPQSIVQRYWVLGDRQRRSGFETLYRVSRDTYYLSSSILAGHQLISTMEAEFIRQPNE
jgi:hypothetical protein